MGKIINLYLFFALSSNIFGQTAYYDKKTELYGVLDRNGKVVLKPTYSRLTAFQFGISRFKENEKWGIIDTTGKQLIPAQFDYCSFNRLGYNEGLISVNYNNKFGFYDLNGKLVIPFIFDLATDFCGNIAFVELGGKFNFINKKGEYISEKWFNRVKIIDGVNYGIDNENIYWAIGHKGIYIAENQDYLSNYRTYYIPYCDNDRETYLELSFFQDEKTKLFGYKNRKSDEIVIQPLFTNVTTFSGGFALVQKQSDMGNDLAIINEKGQILLVIDRKFSFHWDNRYAKWDYIKNGLFQLNIEEKTFILNTRGEIIIEGSFADEILFGEGGDC